MVHEQRVDEIFKKLTSLEIWAEWSDRSQQELVGEIINRLNCGPREARDLLFSLSRRILGFWHSRARDFARASRERKLDNEGFLNVGESEKVAVIIQEIEGPVDITELNIKRITPSERSEFTMALDENGRLEELMHPAKITGEFLDAYGDVLKSYEITFIQGAISQIKTLEYLHDEEDKIPSSTRETNIDHSHILRWLLRKGFPFQPK